MTVRLFDVGTVPADMRKRIFVLSAKFVYLILILGLFVDIKPLNGVHMASCFPE